MASATKIVDKLVRGGLIPSEFKEEATRELNRELLRRSRRTALFLASLVSTHQLAMHFAASCPR